MARALNFNAGPAALPLAALEQAQKELLDLNGSLETVDVLVDFDVSNSLLHEQPRTTESTISIAMAPLAAALLPNRIFEMRSFILTIFQYPGSRTCLTWSLVVSTIFEN